eukprot:TRINITY_DN15331_c0_g1_i1.p2 TRINITY_DN15331_c0_g1~~TRINITY_DN15331_c0_g1_i1.p2  ORF type:complete len:158 (-),score=40.79 TRINITY_DN15331_c0_g1_i1:829-1302(-)
MNLFARAWSATSRSASCLTARNVRHAGSSVDTSCIDSGIRIFAARSRPMTESASYFAIAERLHQFSVLDGVSLGDDSGKKLAAFCAGRLPRNISGIFMQKVSEARAAPSPLPAKPKKKGPKAISFGEEEEIEELPEVTEAAKWWSGALSDGFMRSRS